MIRSAFFGLLGAGLLLACAAPATSDAGDLIPGATGGSAGQSQGGNSSAEGGTTGTTGGSSPGEAGAGGGETAGQGDAGGPQPTGGSSGSGAGGDGSGGSAAGGGAGGSAAGGGTGGSGGSGGSVTSKEPCCVAHDGPGCNDAAIQACVCEQDPTCCSGSWNQFCVNEIKQFGCGSCEGGAGGAGGAGAGGAGAGGSSTAGSGGDAFGGSAGGGAAPTFGGWCCNDKTTSPGCDIPDVMSCVCAEDPFCCNFEWDDLCSAQVTELGCAVCEGGYTCTDYPDQCVDCCISGHLSGYDSFGKDVAQCACNGACESACLSACQGGNVSSGCADCLNQNLGAACPMTTCDADPDCAAYLSCVDPCP